MSKAAKLYIIAGEASGDILGSRFLHALKQQEKNITTCGIGGSRMIEEGFKSLFPMEELSLMGFVEIIPHIPHMIKRINQTVDDIINTQPDILLTIDSPGFNTRVVRKIKQRAPSIRCVHYVAPSVWAYKPKRAQKMAQLYDYLLTLLPFEPPYFEKEGLASTFVGHPLIENHLPTGDKTRFLQAHGYNMEDTIITVLPGSRVGEIKRHWPIFIDTLNIIAKDFPNTKIVVPTTEALQPLIKAQQNQLTLPLTITTTDQAKQDAFAASTIALTKSGTVTLELALAKVPMVVAYKVNPLSAWIIKHMLLTPYVCLINILQQQEVIKECLQNACNSNNLSKELLLLLEDKEAHAKQIQHMEQAIAKLRPDGGEMPSELAVESICTLLPQKL